MLYMVCMCVCVYAGDLTFEHVKKFVEDVVLVTDDDLKT